VSFVEKILNKMSNNELNAAAQEVFEWHNTAILKDGVIRVYAQTLATEGIPSQHVLGIVERYVLEECTKRYLELSQSIGL